MVDIHFKTLLYTANNADKTTCHYCYVLDTLFFMTCVIDTLKNLSGAPLSYRSMQNEFIALQYLCMRLIKFCDVFIFKHKLHIR